ncbi:TrbC/VirB2 family protein [Methylophilus sp. QUAN]|uniref:TrbC/VirB2 family protein n=1 Tax=Methylophilus sp. QUAN TaxID=2781020 RepID=UPI001890AEF2|nr:TrbC/VirB2 family protein [Methylophilus sp. QUAN]MBF4990993.1 TrbC/VirB2 family protein [Methylophilus sp. QUAN]
MKLSKFLGMKMQFIKSQKVQKLFSLLILASCGILTLMPEIANAALPWENPIRQIAGSLCGPVARGFGTIAFVGAGIAIGFGEVKGWIHHMLIVLLGVSIAVLAPTFLGMLGVVSDIACN